MNSTRSLRILCQSNRISLLSSYQHNPSTNCVRNLSITRCKYGIFDSFKSRIEPAGKAVLVTGCDTGFGNSVAKKLHETGFTVFAGVFSKESEGSKALIDLDKKGQNKGHRLVVVPMDVTSDSSCAIAMDQIRASTQSLWAVITNAGWSTWGQAEWVPMDVYDKIIQVNLLGTIRTVRCALPLIRKEKGGRVITVASMLGRYGANSRSAYVTTKWGVEGFSECLRGEMKPWGVHVSIMEPGNFVAATSLYAGGAVQKQADYMWSKLSVGVQQDYGKEKFDEAVKTMLGYTTMGNTQIDIVVNGMVDAVSHKTPKPRYMIMSLKEKLRCWTASHMPSGFYDHFYA